jgi:hypothetical protein
MIYIIHTDGVRYLYGDAKVIHNNDTTYGDIGAYHRIPVTTDRITIFQGRRHLNLPEISASDDKIYHTVHNTATDFFTQWCNCHPKYKDLLLKVEQRIVEKMPEYASTIRDVNEGNEIYPHNMYSMPGALFRKYAAWLDWALHLIELPHQDKVGSLLAERLFTIWLKHHNYPHVAVTATCYDKVTGEVINTTDGIT